MQLKSVVLPAPFGPMSPQIAPGATEKLTSSSAVTPPKRIVRPATRSSARAPAEPSAPARRVVDASMDSPLPDVWLAALLHAQSRRFRGACRARRIEGAGGRPIDLRRQAA